MVRARRTVKGSGRSVGDSLLKGTVLRLVGRVGCGGMQVVRLATIAVNAARAVMVRLPGLAAWLPECLVTPDWADGSTLG